MDLALVIIILAYAMKNKARFKMLLSIIKRAILVYILLKHLMLLDMPPIVAFKNMENKNICKRHKNITKKHYKKMIIIQY